MGAPNAHPYGEGMLSLPVRDLTCGDVIVSGVQALSGSLDPARPAVVGSVAYDQDDEAAPCEIRTSAGTVVADGRQIVAVDRAPLPAPGRPLLVSRRQSLHEQLCLTGVPVPRVTPAAVHPDDYAHASLVIVDGYLARTTLLGMLERGIVPRPATLMVGTDPDDARIWLRAETIQAHGVSFLPDHAEFVALALARSWHPERPDA